MARANRFRYSQFTEAEFTALVEQTRPFMQYLHSRYVEGGLADYDLVASYLLALLVTSEPRLAIGPRLKEAPTLLECSALDKMDAAKGPHKTYIKHQPPNFGEILTQLKLESHPTRFEQLRSLTAHDIFSRYSLRGVPASVNRALVMWSQGRSELRLHFSVCTALEVLQMQARGQRLVTVFLDANGARCEFFNTRDPYSFTLHDLIHADLFFGDIDIHVQQKNFFQSLEALSRHEVITHKLATDLNFVESFNYLASDMNSHPAHLQSFWQHLLQQNKIAFNA